MKHLTFAALLIFFVASAPCQAAAPEVPGDRYDGKWSVVLVCADTQDRRGLVKGYEYKFIVSISDGKLAGQYGSKGSPGSVSYAGTVATDGTLEVKAIGNTGRSDYSVGKVAQGTDYSYTMSGKLESDTGQAVRREIRPCTASFAKQ